MLLRLFYFLLHSTFFKGKVKSGIIGGFYFFKWAFQKTTGSDCLVASNQINTEHNYGLLLDFLSQISKLSYFNMLDLADFMMQH